MSLTTNDQPSGAAQYLDRLEEFSTKMVLVGPFDEHITITQLCNYFCTYGRIEDVYIPRRFPGFAFITFGERLAYESSTLPPPLYGYHEIVKGSSAHVSHVLPANGTDAPIRHHRVFIGKITRGITKEDLKKYFERFGSIEDVWMAPEHFRPFAFITFAGKLNEVPEEEGGPLYGNHHRIKGIHLEVKEASPRPGLMQQKSSAVVEQRHQDPIDIYSTSG